MKPIITLIATATMAFAAHAVIAAPVGNEAPDVLVKRISSDVLDTAKTDKDIQAGDKQKIVSLVQTKILPFVDTEKMTALAAGRFWRTASPAQQQRLSEEFRTLLVYTYSGALSQIKNDDKVEFKPLRADPADTDVEVRSVVTSSGAQPIQLNYRLNKGPQGWKIFDINVLGAWLVETYKGNFSSEINKTGIDGLIAKLADRNKQLAGKPLAAPAK
jgi:phospholipid transport system substrate-binding protein